MEKRWSFPIRYTIVRRPLSWLVSNSKNENRQECTIITSREIIQLIEIVLTVQHVNGLTVPYLSVSSSMNYILIIALCFKIVILWWESFVEFSAESAPLITLIRNKMIRQTYVFAIARSSYDLNCKCRASRVQLKSFTRIRWEINGTSLY